MSKEIQNSWEAYKRMVANGALPSRGLFWPDDCYFSDEDEEEGVEGDEGEDSSAESGRFCWDFVRPLIEQVKSLYRDLAIPS
jgi:hypothetical protein